MSKVYDGQFNIVLVTRKDQPVLTLEKAPDGRFTAADAAVVWEKALTASAAHKAPLDRWAFFVPEICEKMPGEAIGFMPSAVAKLPKAARVPTVGVGKWGKPRLRFDLPTTTQAKASTKVIIE